MTEGQDVAVKIEAFPFTHYGAIPGTVERIGSNAIEDEKLGLVYPIRVRLQRATIVADGKIRPLTPRHGGYSRRQDRQALNSQLPHQPGAGSHSTGRE